MSKNARHDTPNAQIINSPMPMFAAILMPASDLLYASTKYNAVATKIAAANESHNHLR